MSFPPAYRLPVVLQQYSLSPASTPLKLRGAFTFVELNQYQLSVDNNETRIMTRLHKRHTNVKQHSSSLEGSTHVLRQKGACP